MLQLICFFKLKAWDEDSKLVFLFLLSSGNLRGQHKQRRNAHALRMGSLDEPPMSGKSFISSSGPAAGCWGS